MAFVFRHDDNGTLRFGSFLRKKCFLLWVSENYFNKVNMADWWKIFKKDVIVIAFRSFSPKICHEEKIEKDVMSV